MALKARYCHFSNETDHIIIIVVSDRDIHAHAKRSVIAKPKKNGQSTSFMKRLSHTSDRTIDVFVTWGYVAWSYVTWAMLHGAL